MADIRADGIAVYVYRKLKPRGRRAALEFLQVRRSGSAGEYEHSWQTVYGGVKKKETATAAALRELKEETNLTPVRLVQVEFLETFYFRPRDYVLVMPVFAAEVPANAKITLNDEHTAFRWIKEREIEKAFMWRTQREALAHVLDLLHHGSAAMKFLDIDLCPG